MPKRKRKLAKAEKWARRERKQKFTTFFINGKQKQVVDSRPEGKWRHFLESNNLDLNQVKAE